MIIDPMAWLMTLPLLAGLLWAYLQPADHRVKQMWRALLQHEARAIAQLAGAEPRADDTRRVWVERVLFWAAVACLSAGSLASVAAYLGWTAAF